ncbi:glycosyltransferase family 4 protein [Cohnella xylanilytica]|uniref:Glycosyltransferase family 4 protein n=1 Tax=Cohnella xylanilytica TaxID=557555 RepID=A0A841U3F9_9BACL|nr:glycosyltransferase family 4 protein [Cohnella xylanilytica]MBB6692853.1 glycosyltransferase family 4 protein [Cohnella xylanilytica]
MKVLFLTNIPAPYRIDFFNELGKHCDLTVWFEAKNESNREWAIEGLGASFRYKFLPGFTLGLDKHVNFSVIRELNAEPFDVYILGCYSSPTEMMAIRWLKFKKKRFILNSDGGFVSEDKWLLRKLKTSLISSADLWLSSGSNCTRYLSHYGADGRRIREYPFSSVALSEGDTRPLPEGEKEELKRREGLKGTVILSVGQFIHRKGMDVLLDAFARMRNANASLLLIGGGPEREAYEARIRDERIPNVVIKDFMQKRELLVYWKLADVFAMPTRFDIWGLVLNEALAFGLPVVSTTMAGAAHDLVREGENGFLVPPEDAALLGERCERLAVDPELRQTFGAKSREIARGYTMERMVDSHLRIIGSFASGH